jgi:hypothetical protein
MERSDRIGLIVATLLVVALLSGSGYLVWRRSDILGAERGGTTAEATVTLTPIETSEALLPEPAEAKPASNGSGITQPKGSEIAYLTKVRKSGSTYYVTYDPAELLKGAAADLYVKKQGKAVLTATFAVANDKHETKRLPLSKQVLILRDSKTEAGKVTVLRADDLVKAFGAKPDTELTKSTWWVWSSGGVILKLQQAVLK